ncbi:uncharacterized protein [Triticum aestivum]|uniref:uncharacterized protein n=1 Tax=Triticum aestivum TaxID=4565 RepID=UPI001D012111|nr:uncharacterized protein LOC123141675 [Triticum aestivum]
MASGFRSPPSVSSAFPRERPIVSGLGLSESPGLARSSSAAGSQAVGPAPAQAEVWRRPGPSRKAMWRRHRALRRQFGAGVGPGRDASPSSSERRQIPPDLYGLCFRCFEDGHRRQDCTNEPLCIRCGHAGHVSSQCLEPRSPISAEELRCAVIAKVARRSEAPGQAPAIRRRLSEPRQSAPVAPLLPVAPNLHPVLPGAALLVVLSDICVLPRSEGLDDLERRLQLAVVMYVGGARPAVSCDDAAVAISAQLGIPRFRFSVHKFHPEDFLVVFAAHEFRNRALALPAIEHLGVKFFIKPWLRQAQAASRLMRVQVDVMIEDVPSHAWAQETAAELLGSACLIDSLAPETASREDLSLFKLRAWCVDPEEVPVFRRLWVPEQPEVVSDLAARRASFRQLLEYPVFIHVGRLRDFSPPEMWRCASGSDGRSGQSGLPDSSNGSFQGGDWVVQPWARGVRDERGAGRRYNNDGGGGTHVRSYRVALEGRVGPSAWRLPPIGPGSLTVKPAAVLQSHGTVVGQGLSNEPIQMREVLPTVVETAGELALAAQTSPARERPVEQAQVTTCLGSEVVRQEDARTEAVVEPLVVANERAADVDKDVGANPRPIGVGPLQPDQTMPIDAEVGVGADPKQTVVEPQLDQAVSFAAEDPVRLVGPGAAEDSSRGGQGPVQEIPASEDAPALLLEGWAPVSELIGDAARELHLSHLGPGSTPELAQGDQVSLAARDACDGTTSEGHADNVFLHGGELVVHEDARDVHAMEDSLSAKERAALGNIKSFCAGLLKKLAPPLLKEIESV